MCIVSVAWQAHPKWELVVVGNRDELHGRPAHTLSRWEGAEQILSGLDVAAGGTWMGISEEGRFAVVTNVAQANPPNPEAASRGSLLKDFLIGNGSFADPKHIDFAQFNPFNLLTIESGAATIHSNKPDNQSRELEAGIFGLSNGLIDNPWSKSEKLNNALKRWIDKDSWDYDQLLGVLRDNSPVPIKATKENTSERLPPPEHSGLFINNPVYGTRCSSIIAIDSTGKGVFIERSYAPKGKEAGDVRLDFSWPGTI